MAEIVIPFDIVKLNALDKPLQRLHAHTMQALEDAYAPYSQFQVGCGLLLESGAIVTGNNQENAAYPSGLCAERVAFFKLRSESQSHVKDIMVLTRNKEGERSDAFPCGACRQVMLEYAQLQDTLMTIYMQASEDSFYKIDDVRTLLPFCFTNEVL